VVVQADYYRGDDTSSPEPLSPNALPANPRPAAALPVPIESRALVPSADAGLRRAPATAYSNYSPIQLYTRTQRGLERSRGLLDVLA
jgi:hypothetical protein